MEEPELKMACLDTGCGNRKPGKNSGAVPVLTRGWKSRVLEGELFYAPAGEKNSSRRRELKEALCPGAECGISENQEVTQCR